MSRSPQVAVDDSFTVTQRVHDDVQAMHEAALAIAELDIETSSGEPLGDDVVANFGPALGYDLSKVRVHRDGPAGELAAAVGAEAFSVGNHIWFAAGRYQPGESNGRSLIAHELSHVAESGEVVTQSAHTVSTQLPVADAAEEARADEVAEQISGEPSSVGSGSGERTRRGIGTVSRLAKRASASGASVLADVQPKQVLVRLIDTLLNRNPADRGGRVKAVFERMESGTKADVVEKFSERGGSQWSRLSDLLREKSPEDGGADPTEVPEEGAEEEAQAETEIADAEVTDEIDEQAAVAGTGDAAAPEISDEATVETLEFDPDAELPAEPDAALPALAGEHEEDGEEAVAEEPAPQAADGPGTEPLPAGDAATGVVATSSPPSGDTGSAVDIEEELAEALEPALEAQVPTDDEATALVAVQSAVDVSEAEPETSTPEPEAADAPGLTGNDLGSNDLGNQQPEPANLDALESAAPAPVGGGGVAALDVSTPTDEAVEPQEVDVPEPAGSANDGLVDEDSGPIDDAPDPTAAPEAGAPPPGAQGDVPAEVGTEQAGDSCKAPAPAPMQDPAGAGGGCGGGGGGAGGEAEPVTAEAAPTATDTSPAGAVGSVASLRASARPAALESAGTVATGEVSGIQDELAAGPPSIERPSGVPAGRDASIPPAALPAPSGAAKHDPAELDNATGGTVPEERKLPPLPASVTSAVASPSLAGDTKITKADVSKVQKAVGSLPTSDPALDASAGPAPEMVLDGEADPNRVTTQATGVVTTTTDLQTEANSDIVADFGDRDIYPVVPKETLTAKIDVSSIAIAPKSGTADGGKAEPVVIDRLAEEKSGPADRAAIATEASGMTTGRTSYDDDSTESRDKAKQDLDDAVKDNAAAQRGERQSAASAADSSRQAWVDETAKTSKDTRDASTTATDKAETSISTAKADAKKDAKTAVADGNTKIKTARTDAEKDAKDKKAEAKRKSSGGGFFSWLGSKVKSFFNKVKAAIKKTFDAARKLVDKAVKAAQKLAVAAIDAGRDLAIKAIEAGGKALKAAGDIALAGFPNAREKWRATIDKGVDASKKAVNKLADGLKAAALAILDFLGKALKAYLSALEKLYTMAVEAVESVVQGAIKFAKAVADTFGEFLAIAADVARNPLSWLKKLGSGAANGAKNCTWPSLKTAVKTWFREKVEALVGVGKAVFDVLLKGCINFAQVAKMAWSAIKASLPVVLVQLLVEKLVAMLIPAGGALSLIIDGLRAAWGAANRILAAFQAFIAFLKSVRSGQSAPKFGSMVGAAATAVLDFLSNFVLQRIMGAGKKVGAALKATAGKIMAQLKRAAAAAKRVAGKAMGAAKKAGKSAIGAAKVAGKKAVGVVKAGAKKAGRAIAKTKVGKAVIAGVKGIGRGARKVMDKGKKALDKRRQKKAAKSKKPPKKKETPQQKLDRIVTKIQPTIQNWATRGVGGRWFNLKLAGLRRWHRLRALDIEGTVGPIEVVARVNPRRRVVRALKRKGERLREMVYEVASELERDPKVRWLTRRYEEQFDEIAVGKSDTVEMAGGAGSVLAFNKANRRRRRVYPQRQEGYDSAKEGNEVKGVPHREKYAIPRADDPTQKVEVHNQFGNNLGHYRPKPGSAAAVGGTKTRIPRKRFAKVSKFAGHIAGAGKYKDMTARLRAIAKKRGMSDAQIFDHVDHFGRFGTVKKGVLDKTESAQVGKIAATMWLAEGKRDNANSVYAAMTSQMVKSGDMSIAQAFGRRSGGAFPMSFQKGTRKGQVGPEAAAAELAAERSGGVVKARRSKHAKRLARKQISLIAKWVASKLIAAGGEIATDDATIKALIMREMKQHFMQRMETEGATE